MANVLVIGAARSGNAAAKLLRQNGNNVTLTDMKPAAQKEELESLGIRVLDEGHPDFLYEEQFDYVVKILEFHIRLL